MATLEAEVDWKTSYYALDRLYEKRERRCKTNVLLGERRRKTAP